MSYQLIRNHLDDNAPYDGCMFETFGAEAAFVCQQPSTKIWTLLDCDGELLVHAGWHFVNRLGYFVTEQPWSDPHECFDFDSDTFTLPNEEAMVAEQSRLQGLTGIRVEASVMPGDTHVVRVRPVDDQDRHCQESDAEAGNYVIWCEGRLEELRMAGLAEGPPSLTGRGRTAYKNLIAAGFRPSKEKVILTLRTDTNMPPEFVEKFACLMLM